MAVLTACCALLASGLTAGAEAKEALSDEELQRELQAVRAMHPGYFHNPQSSVLGKLVGPAELAATRVDFRKLYEGRPARALSEEEKARVLKQYGHVTLFFSTRSACETFRLGITGAQLREMSGQGVPTVAAVDQGSAADGVLAPGDVIVGAYGRLFPEDDDPRIPIGYALADAQTAPRKGILLLDVARQGKVLPAKVEVGVQGAYSRTWPLGCEKSRKIADATMRSILNNTEAEKENAYFNTLFLMGTGNAEALEHVRRRFYAMRGQENLGRGGLNSWSAGYSLIGLAEYYLLTGDSAVLDPIRTLVGILEDGQMPCGSWSHGCPPGGYGAVNQVGQTCLMGLVLAREAGFEVDAAVLRRSIRFFGRGVGTCMPYGNHPVGRSWLAYNGMNATRSLVYHFLGADDMARATARPICYHFRNRLFGHAARIFPIAWGPAGAALAPAEEFHLFMNNLIWYFELARGRDGAIELCRQPDGVSMKSMDGGWCPGLGAIAMCFAMPQKRLRVFGAPRGVFGTRPPAELKAARDLYAQKKWAALEKSLNEYLAKPGKKGKGYAQALLAAYRRLEAQAASTIELIERNIERRDADLAARQLTALKVLLGEERPEMKGLAERIGALPTESPEAAEVKPAPPARTMPPPAPAEWDVLLSGGQDGSEFTTDQTYSYLRLTLHAPATAEVYLNGKRIAAIGPGARRSKLRILDLGKQGASALCAGKNVITVPGNDKLRFDLAAGPSQRKQPTIATQEPPFSSLGGGRNGWAPKGEKMAMIKPGFFEGKAPREVARYLVPVSGTAVNALASHGKRILPLVKKLLDDSHPAMRCAAWDTVAKLHKQGDLAERREQEAVLRIAAARADHEDSWVLQAVAEVMIKLGIKNKDTGRLLLAMSASRDAATRGKALKIAGQKGMDPAVAIKVAGDVARHLEGTDPAVWGNAFRILSNHKALPDVRSAVPAIALVLDEVAHELRGMFSNGVMSGGLPVILEQLDAELEKTPRLVSGLCKCFIKGPKTSWRGWVVARTELKRAIYRLSPAAADEIRRAAADQRQWLKTVSDVRLALITEGRRYVEDDILELEAWADLLTSTRGKLDRKTLEAFASSNSAAKRRAALSVARLAPDRLDDGPAQALEIATLVAGQVKGDDSWEGLEQHVGNQIVFCEEMIKLSMDRGEKARPLMEQVARIYVEKHPMRRGMKKVKAAIERYEKKYGKLKTSIELSRGPVPDTSGLKQGLIGYWQFDEGKGAESADSSGRNNKAILKGGATWAEGLIGKSLKTGKRQWAEVPGYKDPISNGRIEKLSVSYWIRTAYYGSARIGKGKETRFAKTVENWFISYWASGAGWDVCCPDNMAVPFLTATFDNKPHTMAAWPDSEVKIPAYMWRITDDGKQWHHVVAVYDGNKRALGLYVDGNRSGTRGKFNCRSLEGIEDENHVIPAVDDTLTFGGKFTKDEQVESFDEIAIWDRVITDKEVKTLYNRGFGAVIE